MSKLLVKALSSNWHRKYRFILNLRMQSDLVNTRKMEENIFHRYRPITDVPSDLFKGNSDRFNGVTVTSSQEFDQNDSFPDKLERSLNFWKENQRRGIWFKVQKEHSDWVPHLTKQGFDFHHAKSGYVVLFKWLPENESVNIPEFAHTMIGVGGLVVNEKNQVLVVRENYSLVPNNLKLPGGYVEPKESLIEAVIREVKEETGIDTKCETLLSFRHAHGGVYGCSDLYLVFGLSPVAGDEIVRCEREIAEVEWIAAEEFLKHPHVSETNRVFLTTYLDYKERDIKIEREEKIHTFLKKKFDFYTVKPNKL